MSLNNDELCLLNCFLSSPDYDNLITPDSEADAGETKHSQKDEKKAALHGLYQHVRDKVRHHKRKRECGQKLPLTALATKKEEDSAKRRMKQVDAAKSMCLHGLLQSKKDEWERAQQYAVQQRLLQIEREKKVLRQQLQIEMKALHQRELQIEHGHNRWTYPSLSQQHDPIDYWPTTRQPNYPDKGSISTVSLDSAVCDTAPKILRGGDDVNANNEYVECKQDTDCKADLLLFIDITDTQFEEFGSKKNLENIFLGAMKTLKQSSNFSFDWKFDKVQIKEHPTGILFEIYISDNDGNSFDSNKIAEIVNKLNASIGLLTPIFYPSVPGGGYQGFGLATTTRFLVNV